jgi:hypothetical protein
MSKQTIDAESKQSGIPLKKFDEQILNDSTLITSVEDRLSNLKGITGIGKPGTNPAVDLDDDESVDEAEDKGNTDLESIESTLDSKAEPQADPKDPIPDKEENSDDKNEKDLSLPEAYVRCAVDLGWTKEEVLDEFRSNPQRTLKILSNRYNNRNSSSAQFAQLGRQAKKANERIEIKPEIKDLPKLDLNKLKEVLGEDAIPLVEVIDVQSKQINELLNQTRPVVTKTEEAMIEPDSIEQSGIEQQVYRFFESDDMKSYIEVYGKLKPGQNWHDLTPGQQTNRLNVLKQADMIAGGAHLQGVKMGIDEALTNAHLLQTRDYHKQIVVNELKGKVIQRNNGISLKPSKGAGKKNNDNEPGSKTKDKLLIDTQTKLNSIFG